MAYRYVITYCEEGKAENERIIAEGTRPGSRDYTHRDRAIASLALEYKAELAELEEGGNLRYVQFSLESVQNED